jgi:hypothetical protein
MKGPWFITEEDAAARDRAVLAQYQRDLLAVGFGNRPMTAVRLALAARGYDSTMLLRLASITQKEMFREARS